MPLEPLEIRVLLSVSLANGVATVVGTDANDDILVAIAAAGVEFRVNGVVEATTAYRKLKRIEIHALGGKDRVEVRPSVRNDFDALLTQGVDVPCWIEGAGGNDHITGGGGDDTIVGGSGADTLAGDRGNDQIGGGANADKIDGGFGNDSLGGGGGNDRLHGGVNHPRPRRNLDADVITGGAGTDVADYSSGTNRTEISLDNQPNDGYDYLDLPDGSIFVDPETFRVREGDNVFDDVENIVGSQAEDLIIGSAKDNALLGMGGTDTIRGEGGNDLIFGGSTIPPADAHHVGQINFGVRDKQLLDGGAGADTLYGGDDGGVGTVADYGARTDALSLSLDGLANDGAAGEADFIGPGIAIIVGGRGADTITGSDRADMLLASPESAPSTGGDSVFGMGGNDTLFGGSGDDVLDGGDGDDRLDDVRGGINTMHGGGGNDLVFHAHLAYGGPGHDDLTGSVDGTLIGGGGNDILRDAGLMSGGHGNDQIYGRPIQNNHGIGGPGDDLLVDLPSLPWISEDADTMDGGDGTDTVRVDDGDEDTILACEIVLPPE